MIADMWGRLPVLVRAVAAGLLIRIAGVFFVGALTTLNLRAWPSVPWSVPLELGLLWCPHQYLRGRWWPTSTWGSKRARPRLATVSRALLAPAAATGLAAAMPDAAAAPS